MYQVKLNDVKTSPIKIFFPFKRIFLQNVKIRQRLPTLIIHRRLYHLTRFSLFVICQKRYFNVINKG